MHTSGKKPGFMRFQNHPKNSKIDTLAQTFFEYDKVLTAAKEVAEIK